MHTLNFDHSRTMAARAAVGRALLTTGGTIVGLGAATFLVSSVSMGVARAVIHERKKKLAVSCTVCSGKKRLTCDVCRGDKVIKYHPFKDLPPNPRMQWCCCAMCGATGEQTCLNCQGEGIVLP